MSFNIGLSGLRAATSDLNVTGNNIANAGTTGFNLTMDARFLWMRQKRVQGSHFANLMQASAANQLVIDRRVDPCMSEVFPWADIPKAHTLMWKNQHKPGNMAVLVQAPRPGLKTFEDTLEASRSI